MTPDAAAWDALRLSLWVAFWATLLAIPLAVWVAWLLARKDFWGKAVLNAAVHLPLVLPPVVTGYLLLLAFGRTAPLGQALNALGIQLAFHWTGAVLAAMIMGFPLMVRAMRLAIEAVDPKLEDTAATLGAPRGMVFFRVTLPLILPGVLAGTVMGFAKAMGEFGATITFVANIPGKTQTLPSAIWAALQIPGGERQAVMMVLMASTVAIAAVLLAELLARRVAARIAGA
ncbi:MAG: molybdate ABC transporter permease subunit [Sulfitobacter sp.]|jgi:molybdate transport system permease protein|uniref:molybdate ABC transporter permease subunit n=1 Tax=Sulfitobacter sp. TaxID=1903071 RepID=UPI000C10F8DA|nr:molybdate ABC transporter permease subunit [Roseobacter sp.]MBV48019.1 molybdate ABC transporter permease subunit [Roseobacter sp.]PHR03298.1 MAG: molybdate ABC transporter permease subunit [Sulfitobacter sp.]|tara:strand:+ start:2898 stop:3587 length:690 start_codon:yes stop_codon:yes gene_type:complete